MTVRKSSPFSELAFREEPGNRASEEMLETRTREMYCSEKLLLGSIADWWKFASRGEMSFVDARIAGELMFEIDSLYVSTEMILSRRFRERPLDGLLLEACLLHFRVVWDFFYRPKKKSTDVVVRDYIPAWTDLNPPPRLKDIREKGRWLDVMIAHLTTHRVDPNYKAGEITEEDVKLMREHTRNLFIGFCGALTEEQRKELSNTLAAKFARYNTLEQ